MGRAFSLLSILTGKEEKEAPTDHRKLSATGLLLVVPEKPVPSPNAENMFHAQPIPDCQTPAQKKLYWCAWNTEKKETPLTPCELSLCLPKEKKKEKKIEYGPLILSLILNSSSNTFANGQSTENALGQFLAIQ